MQSRVEQRLVIALPIRVYGMASDGRPFNQEALTLDITHDGARIDGLPPINIGETVGVQYGEDKARYKVVWVGETGGKREGQIGVQVVQGKVALWHKILEATPDEIRSVEPEPEPALELEPEIEREPARVPPVEQPPQHASPQTDISTRVRHATEALRAIEKLIQSGGVDGVVMHEFHDALEHLRQTSAALLHPGDARAKGLGT